MAFSNETISGPTPMNPGTSKVVEHNLWTSNSLYGDFSIQAIAEHDATITVEISNNTDLLGWVPATVINLVGGEMYFERLDLKPCKFVKFTTTNTSNVINKVLAVVCFV